MLTFDEAIDSVFITSHATDSAETLKEKTRKAVDVQISYLDEAIANGKLIRSLALIQKKMTVNLIDLITDTANCDVLGLTREVQETLITVFLWGLATGRKMNELDRPAIRED